MMPGSLLVLMAKGSITIIKIVVKSRKFFCPAKERKNYSEKMKFDFDLEKLVRFNCTVSLFQDSSSTLSNMITSGS